MADQHEDDHDGTQQHEDAAKDLDEMAVVRCGTTKGDIEIEFFRGWSPHGYDRAVELFESGFYDESHFFRMVPNFLVQFGITYNPDLKARGQVRIPDDPQLDPPIRFTPGTLSYAGNGPNSRTSQLFVAFTPGAFGREKWETPVGRVSSGFDKVKSFYSGYGDMPPWGKGPLQPKIQAGPEYIEKEFPELDKFLNCIVERHAAEEQYHRQKQNKSAAEQQKRTLRKGEHHHDSTRGSQKHHAAHDVKQHHPSHKQHHPSHKQHHSQQQHEPHPGRASREILTPKVDGPLEEGVTTLSWELLSFCLFLFLGALALWLNFVFGGTRKSRKTQ